MSISFEKARQLAEKAFDKSFGENELVITSIEAFSYGWVFFASLREAIDEGHPKSGFDGLGPFLVTNGEVVFLPSVCPPVVWLRRWEIEHNQKSDLASRPEARRFAAQQLHLLLANAFFRFQADEICIDIVQNVESIESDFRSSYRKSGGEWVYVEEQYLFTALMFEQLKEMAEVKDCPVIAIDHTQTGQFDIKFSGSSEAFKNCKAIFTLQAQFEPIENGTRATLFGKLKSVEKHAF